MSDDTPAPLVPLADLGLAPADAMDGELDALTRTSDFLPQIRVYGSETNVVKEGKFPLGHMGLYYSSDKIVDLTKEFDCICFSARPRATILADTPVSYYDITTEEFISVKQQAMSGTRGYLCGLEYLLYVPAVEAYALFLMGNKTLRRESGLLKALIGHAATIKVKLIKTSEFTWHGAQVLPCSTPFQMPERDKLQTVIDDFKNPVGSGQKLAKDGEDTGRQR